MDSYSIDINVEVGEGINNESQLLPYVSSCNMACGGHAGNEDSMRAVIKLAKQNGVKIGAHPSFPDKENFGRKAMHISNADLYTSIKGQIRALTRILREEHAVLHHIKPHGALYYLVASNKDTALVIIEVMKSIAMPIKLYVPYGSVIADLALQEQIPILYEAFADRNYNDDLTLVSRQKGNSIISDAEAVYKHVYLMISQDKVKTVNGIEVAIKANTYCVHGDNPNAADLAKILSEKL